MVIFYDYSTGGPSVGPKWWPCQGDKVPSLQINTKGPPEAIWMPVPVMKQASFDPLIIQLALRWAARYASIRP